MSFLFCNLIFPEFLTALKYVLGLLFFLYHVTKALELFNLIFVKSIFLLGIVFWNLVPSSSHVMMGLPGVLDGRPTCPAGTFHSSRE